MQKQIVLAGAGHAHVQVLEKFGEKPMAGVRLTLITRNVHTPYSGMLPGLIAGHYSFDEVHIDARHLCRFAGASFIEGAMAGLDRNQQRVICEDGSEVPYDILSIDIGSSQNTGEFPGAAEYAIPVKPIDEFLPRFETLRQRVMKAQGQTHIATVGAGAGGVELTLAIAYRLRRELISAAQNPSALAFTLVSAEPEILPDFPQGFRRRLRRILDEHGIRVITGAPVTHVEAGRLHFDGCPPLAVDEIVWVTAAKAPDWLSSTGLALDEKGFIKTDADLRAEGQDNIFASGDIMAFTPRQLPKSGVYAVRSGPVLTANIRHLLNGDALKPYKPQREALYLISTGEKHAVGTRNGFALSGDWLWLVKDWLDRRFVARFNRVDPDSNESGESALNFK